MYIPPIRIGRTIEEQSDRLKAFNEDWAEAYKSRLLDRITIDNNEFSGYFEYSFIEEKTYVEQPERSDLGTISNINDMEAFLTPRLVIKYNYMHISDYRRMIMLLNSKNEFTVSFYDIVKDKRVTQKMYFATPENPKIHQKYLEVLGVQDYTIELIGTNNDIVTYEVYYDFNIPSDAQSYWQTSGFNTNYTLYYDKNVRGVVGGDNVTYGSSEANMLPLSYVDSQGNGALTSQGYLFDGWNTSADGTGLSLNYIDGEEYLINDNMTLYAQWRSHQ